MIISIEKMMEPKSSKRWAWRPISTPVACADKRNFIISSALMGKVAPPMCRQSAFVKAVKNMKEDGEPVLADAERTVESFVELYRDLFGFS